VHIFLRVNAGALEDETVFLNSGHDGREIPNKVPKYKSSEFFEAV